jgi:radical SAM/Cys-rich protein
MKTAEQLRKLQDHPARFDRAAGTDGRGLRPLTLETFQVNVGKKCNQACRHCHVDASPARNEMMDRETVDLCLEAIASVPEIRTVDITGGAPEINEHFRRIVLECRRLGKHVIDRCNLTILEEPGYEYLYDFLAENEVEVIASLPHYARSNTDRQRGSGVFDTSITALGKLNRRGYGTRLPLNLVYNPVGLYLSSPQKQLEREFKENLDRRFGIVFNHLYCLNNMPINRFLESLLRVGKFEQYMETLVNAFNATTLEGLMCRHQISVGYDGRIYDCDFNQMLELGANPVSHVRDFDHGELMRRRIKTAGHCFGCTAGAGSSCGGEIVGRD